MDKTLDKWSKPNSSIIAALERLFEQKKLVLVSFFLANPDKEFTLSEINESTKIPLATLHRYLKTLVSADILFLHEIKKLKLYSLKKNNTTLFLGKFIGVEKKSPLQEFVDRVSKLSGITYIIRYGKEDNNKVNILLIGDIGNNADETKEAEKISRSIRIQYNYKINHLSLTKEQYHQMTQMGLYSGQKTVIFKK